MSLETAVACHSPPRQYCLVGVHDPALEESSSLKWIVWPFDPEGFHGVLRTVA